MLSSFIILLLKNKQKPVIIARIVATPLSALRFLASRFGKNLKGYYIIGARKLEVCVLGFLAPEKVAIKQGKEIYIWLVQTALHSILLVEASRLIQIT